MGIRWVDQDGWIFWSARSTNPKKTMYRILYKHPEVSPIPHRSLAYCEEFPTREEAELFLSALATRKGWKPARGGNH